MIRMANRRTWDDRSGSVMLEFAIIGTALLLASLGAMELGLILWTQGSLQSVASEAARCGAVGASGCTSAADIQTWVQTVEAPIWIPSSIASNLTVNVNSAVSSTACPAISVGTYSSPASMEVVEITTSFNWLPWPFGDYTIDVCASYAH